MPLSLTDALREASSLPAFTGNDQYGIENFLRDIRTILEITPAEHHPTIKVILANKVQGKALDTINSLQETSWDNILNKLREEFGVKQTFFNLRKQAMDVSAFNLEELHYKLIKILGIMNKK